MSNFLPETAPFNDEQRAWLNGFFAGLTGIQSGSEASASLALQDVPKLDEPEEDEDFAWHDAALPIVDRMQLAEGKPLERRLMAAMAQLDCGSCGYLCKTYSEAIASGSETNLTLCSPGGKETKQMIKKLLADGGGEGAKSNGVSAGNGNVASNGHAAQAKAPGYSRQNPFAAKLVESRPLNGEGSAKDTRHVVIDLSGSGLTYHVGDALGVFPTNCEQLARHVVRSLAADPGAKVTTPLGNQKPLLDAIVEDCCLKDPSDELLELLINRLEGDAKETLTQMLNDGVPAGFDVLDVLDIADGAAVSPTEVIETLEPLNPRLYSIASSMKSVGDQVHLTVGKVTFEREGRIRKGVASTMLADRIDPGQGVRVFIQPNHAGFTTTSDPTTPMIMVGPGTGIAPFIAFLQERCETKATGKNWLFFGDQREAFDFLYKDDLCAYQRDGLLTRLDTAFSRDGQAKVYVQDRMRENGAELWKWLSEGACFYVCGDASRMATDVDRALRAIVAEHGGMSEEQATAYVKQMSAEGRYHRDVY